MDARPHDQRRKFRSRKNITRTFGAAHDGASRCEGHVGSDDATRCTFIAAGRWQAGMPPYCGRPALRGSAYCREHAALCGVDPASDRGAAIAGEQERAAQEIAFDICPVPEPGEEETLEAWELPDRARGTAEEA